MEHPFFPTTTTRAEALRWLTIAEKLLSARDLMGSKSFATRARDSDPTLTHADQILAVADTLLAGDRRIGSNQHDWYSILRLTPQQGRDPELIASQYRTLAVLLNPQTNNFPLADQAFRLVVDAWATLSNPPRKAMYDKDLAFYIYPQQHQQQQQQQQHPDPFSGNPYNTGPMHQNFMFFGGGPPQSQGHVGHFSQVPQVDPVASGGVTREPQSFVSFASGSNPFFGVRTQGGPESYPAFGGNVGSSVHVATTRAHEQVSNRHDHGEGQVQHDYAGVSYRTSDDNVNVGENVEERVEGVVEEENVDDGMGGEEEEEEDREDVAVNDDGLAFWTACPYCYYMYEYPVVYVDCTLRCQNCEMAFQAVVIPSPPPFKDGEAQYFCCWGFMPFGFSAKDYRRGAYGNSTQWVYKDDDDAFVDISDSSESDDADWHTGSERKKKKMNHVRAKGVRGTTNRSARKAGVDKGKNVNVDVQDGAVLENGVETSGKTTGEASKKGGAVNARKQPGRVAKNYGKLDLNVECSNEAEEPAQRMNQGNVVNRGEDDNIEGIGFFEGLDEIFSSLPILSVVGNDKVVKAA